MPFEILIVSVDFSKLRSANFRCFCFFVMLIFAFLELCHLIYICARRINLECLTSYVFFIKQ